MTEKKRKRGRPVKNRVECINANAETIAKAIFAEADSRIQKREKSRG